VDNFSLIWVDISLPKYFIIVRVEYYRKEFGDPYDNWKKNRNGLFGYV